MTERDILRAVLGLPASADRAAYLDRACNGDTALRARVEAQLRSHGPATIFLGQPAVGTPEAHSDRTQELDGDPPAHQAPADGELTFLTPSRRPDALGRLGHYEILQVLGRGAFGIVFRAFDDTLQRVVAVKVLAPELAAASAARKRFLREARTSAAVRHENVVQVYAVEEEPLPYLVMEFVPGETLQQRLERTGPLEVAEVVRIGRQIAEGLAAAHASDLIHRDIKPGNILMEGGHQGVKITDFGLARAADDASLSQSGLIAGTPLYMAPEQALADTLDQRADLFSLGSVLYHMVAGHPPFRASSTLAVLKRVAEDTPRAIREIIPETPQWLCDIIARLQRPKNPDDRFQSAREVAEVLEYCEAQRKAGARLKDFPRFPQGKSPSAGRQKWIAAAAVVLLSLLALALTEIIGLTHVFRGQHPTPDATSPPAAIAPFNAAQARAHQEAWAKHLGVPVEYTNSIGMKFVLIPPGEFTMGSTPEEIEAALKEVGGASPIRSEAIKSEAPRHKVILTQPYYLGITEVTQAEYEKVMGYNPSQLAKTGRDNKDVDRVAGLDTANHPVEMVHWNDASEFCAKLTLQEKLTLFKFGLRDGETVRIEGTGYRLPSEAEWEFACRAGTTTKFWIGDNDLDLKRAGWTGANSRGRTHAAGELKANPFGLYDSCGNVWEWVADGWEPTYYGGFAEKPAINPCGPSRAGSLRVLRGNCWNSPHVSWGRSSARQALPAATRYNTLGFRAAMAVDAVKAAQQHAPPLAVAPDTDADVERIASLPAAEQVEEVRKELVRRNADFVGNLVPTIENASVTGLKWAGRGEVDITPVRALTALTTFDFRMGSPRSALADISPLRGMKLTTLRLHHTNVADLSPLKGMPLTKLEVSVSNVSDLSPIKGMRLTDFHGDNTPIEDLGPLEGMPLRVLNCSRTRVATLAPLKEMPLRVLYSNNTRVSDLTPLRGMALEVLTIHNTQISDLSALKGMPLQTIYLDFDRQRDEAILRSFTTLHTINDKPAAEFWKEVERK